MSDSRYYRVDEGGAVGFRRTPKLNDQVDRRRFPAAGPRSIWYAVMEQPGWIKAENGLWLPTQYLEQVAPVEDEQIEVTFTAEGPLGLILLPDSSPVLLAQVAPATAAAFPALVPGIALMAVQGRSIEGQRCADVVQQLKNSERPVTLTFQRFVSVAPPAWRPGQNIEAAAGVVVAVGGQVTQGLGRAFGRLAGGLLGAGVEQPPPQAMAAPQLAAAAPPRLGGWEVTVTVPRVVSMTYYQMAVAVGEHQHWSAQKRWSQFLELDAHLRDAFQEEMVAVPPFPAPLLQDSRKGDPAFVEQRRAALESYLTQLLARIQVLLEFEPFLTFIAVTEHMHHLQAGSIAGATGGVASGDLDGTDGPHSAGGGADGGMAVDSIDSGAFMRSATSTGSTHGAPTEGMVCLASGVAITSESHNYVEYQTAPSMQWAASQWCEAAVQDLIETQFEIYLGGLTITAENAQELSAAMVSGLRVWLCDPTAFPLPMGDTHVYKVWYARDGKERSGRLLQTGPRATRMRRLVEGKDSESDDEGSDDAEGGGGGDGGAAGGEDGASDEARYERLERLRSQAEKEHQQKLAEVAAAQEERAPAPAPAAALPPGRWDNLPRIPAAPWQPMSVSGTGALGDVMTTLATSFNAAGVCVGLVDWVGHAVVAVGATPVLGRAELCYQLSQLPLVAGTGAGGTGSSATVAGAGEGGGAAGVELTLAPVADALTVYSAMIESRETRASDREFAGLDGLLLVVRNQREQLDRLAPALLVGMHSSQLPR